MLVIGDIHATWLIIDEMIESLRSYIAQHSDEHTLVFVWDYVYHFSYDRKVLLQFFRFLLELVQQEKHVYILAWNHDRIAQQFVFSEWAEILSIIDTWQMRWLLHFITKPLVECIEWITCVFFPYCTLSDQEPSDVLSQELIWSSHKKEQWSWYAHVVLQDLIERAVAQSPDKKIILFHHWYINNTAFPWQFATFSYRSPAISEQWLDDPRLLIISGHLHQPFVYKNYLCTWSIRFTSSLETNQCKYLFKIRCFEYAQNNTETLFVEATEVRLHPYCTVAYWSEKITYRDLEEQISTNRQHAHVHLTHSPFYHCTVFETPVPYKSIQLYITHQWSAHRDLMQYCDDELLEWVSTVTIKTKHAMMNELVSSLYDASLSLDQSIADWKTLLLSFLVARYGEEEAATYISILEELQIL
jgi:hypothetical protein